MPKREEKKTRNLLGATIAEETDTGEEVNHEASSGVHSETSKEIVSYWAPNVTVTLVSDLLSFKAGQLPPQVRPFLKIDRRGRFQPIVFFNDFWLLDEHWNPLNDSITEDLELHFSFSPIGSFRWQLYHQMDQSLDMQRSNFGSSQSEIDQLKVGSCLVDALLASRHELIGECRHTCICFCVFVAVVCLFACF
jgi:Cleft lip and palate transmembrane protein 1 (CLPTM1)